MPLREHPRLQSSCGYLPCTPVGGTHGSLDRPNAASIRDLVITFPCRYRTPEFDMIVIAHLWETSFPIWLGVEPRPGLPQAGAHLIASAAFLRRPIMGSQYSGGLRWSLSIAISRTRT